MTAAVQLSGTLVVVTSDTGRLELTRESAKELAAQLRAVANGPDEVERLWGRTRGRRKPPPVAAAVLTTLFSRDGHASEIARVAHCAQSNVSMWLPRLAELGFVTELKTVQLGNQGGGYPAVVYGLTRKGSELVIALLKDGR
jgi:predicted transcriptional regulator